MRPDPQEAVRPLAERLSVESRNLAFAEQRWSGTISGKPVLHLEDVSAIPFVSLVPGVEEYQHRARVRAGDGDLFVTVTPSAEGYEEYCRGRLRLGSPELIVAEPDEHPYAVAAACLNGSAYRRIVERATEARGMVIHPYMAIDTVWELARKVAHDADVTVEVIGPPPPALWIANDKARLTEVVCRVLSSDWVVETHGASDPRGMADKLRELAGRHERVALKRTCCASAMGNGVFDRGTIRSLATNELLEEVDRFLERTEWITGEEVLIVAWEETNDSPSTQLWIPPQGDPEVQGVYEQLLEGDEKIFLGSRPSQLGEEIDGKLIDASLRVGAALQSLGYTGRCSFDFIVVHGDAGDYRIKFVECNGRWGGTSTPMRLVHRLRGNDRRPYRAQDFMHRDLQGVGFGEILKQVGDEIYDPASGDGRYVFYNVGPLARDGKLDVIAFGDSVDDANRAIVEELPRLLGLS